MGRGLFPVENPYDKATRTMAQASGSMAQQHPDQKSETEVAKTAGGAIMSGAGTAAAGAMIGTGVSTGASAGPVGAIVGGVVGLLAYFLS